MLLVLKEYVKYVKIILVYNHFYRGEYKMKKISKKVTALLLTVLLLCNVFAIAIFETNAAEVNEIQVSSNKIPFYLTDQEARCFIGFIYNTNDLTQEQLTKYDMYKLLTGQLSGEEEQVATIQFSETMMSQLSRTVDNLDYINGYSSDNLISYLTTKANGNFASDVVNETLHKIGNSFFDLFLDEYTIHGGTLENMEYEYFQNGLLAWNAIDGIASISDKVQAYKNQILALSNATFYVSSANRKEMYDYFLTYKNNISIKYTVSEDAFDLVMDANELCNEKLAIIKALSPTLSNWGFLDNNMLLWGTEDRIALIEKWAEFTYLLEESITNTTITSNDDTSSQRSAIRYSLIPSNYLSYEIRDDFAYINSYTGNFTAAMIPYEIEGHMVKGINDNAFSENKSLRYIYIPGTVSYIGENAFKNCYNLQQAYIPNGKTNINNKAFSVYRKLTINNNPYILDKNLSIEIYSSSGASVENYCNLSNISFVSLDWDGKSRQAVLPIDNTYYVGSVAELYWVLSHKSKASNVVISGILNFNSHDMPRYGSYDSPYTSQGKINIISAEFNNTNSYNPNYWGTAKTIGLIDSAKLDELYIDGLSINSSYLSSAEVENHCYGGLLFGYLKINKKMVCKNININDSNVNTTEGTCGGLFGCLYIDNNATATISRISTNYHLGGIVRYLESLVIGGVTGQLINYGEFNISHTDIKGNFETISGNNMLNKFYSGYVGGIIGCVDNSGNINAEYIKSDFSAETHSSYDNNEASHYIGVLAATVNSNTGKVCIKNSNANVIYIYGDFRGYFGGNTKHLSIENSTLTVTIPNDVKYINSDNSDYITGFIVDNNHPVFSTEQGILLSKKKESIIRYPNGLEQTSYTIPNYISDLSLHSFQNSKNLKSISIPNNVTCISHYAFEGCTNLTDVYYEGSNSEWKNNVKIYDYNDDLLNANMHYKKLESTDSNIKYKIINSSSVTITGYTGTDNELIIPDILNNYNVVGIDEGAFDNCPNLTSVSIRKNIKSIDSGAFRNCRNLSKINVSDGNPYFSSLNGVLFNKDFTSIVCYPQNKTESEYSLPDSVVSISEYAFCNCLNLSYVNIPKGIKAIGDYIFYGCTNLSNLNMPDDCESIGNYSFYGCTNLSNLKISNNCRSIGDYAFYGCENLTCLEFTEKIDKIGNYAFGKCEKISYVKFLEKLDLLGDYAFSNCNNISYVEFSKGVDTIGSYAFYKCANLSKLSCYESLNYIGYYAFYYCENITCVYLPNNTQRINNGAFRSCDKLCDVYYDGNADEWKKIDIGEYNQCLLKCNIHCKDTVILAPEVTDQGKVYFKNTFNWSKVYCYMWTGSGGEGYQNSVWPGVNMVDEGNDIWSCDLSSKYSYIIFSDGNMQSTDLVIPGDGYIAIPTNSPHCFDVSWEPYTSTNNDLGDVNRDGIVNIHDATIIQKHIVNLYEFTDEQVVIADVNLDGIVDITDVTKIQEYIVGYVDKL